MGPFPPPYRVAVAVALALLLGPPLAWAEPTAGRAITDPVRVTALAVEETDEGFVGVSASVEAVVLGGGSGNVYVSTKPLAQTDMQGSARLAAQVAAATLGVDWREQDYLVSFTSKSPVIGGPSAGAVMTLALTVALHNHLASDDLWTVDATVAATGTINPDGTIGPVGGVPAKAEAAAEAGVRTFLYPAGMDRARTVVRGASGLVEVTVDMAGHCQALGISCRPAARIEELIRAGAGVEFEVPDAPVPGTVDYAAILAPSVNGQVARLEARIAGVRADAAYASLRTADRARVDEHLRTAEADHEAALDALEAGQYYRAATETFQGAIEAGTAENVTRYANAARRDVVVRNAVAGCEAAVAIAEEAATAPVEDYVDLFAVGAAQERLGDSRALLDQVRRDAASAATWLVALERAAFCTERAGTVTWWADLRDAFPEGVAVGDVEAAALQALDDAAHMVSYAQAVLQQAGGSELLQAAQARLQEAILASEDGFLAGTAVIAVQASSLASVAMQATAGGAVPDEVLAAAEQGAARAIAGARARGVEPILAVSLVELAQGQEGAERLHSYWTARSLALLDVVGGGAAGGPSSHVLHGAPRGSFDGSTLVAFLVMGVVVGLAGSGVVVVALMGRRAGR